MIISEKSTKMSPYLQGNFAPVSEEYDCELPEVLGKIPNDMEGSFLRIGPNPVYIHNDGNYHWFDGDGMIHKVDFSHGRATYRNRFVATRGLTIEKEQGKAIWTGYSTFNQDGRLNQPYGMFRKNVANTNLIRFNGKLLALWEGGLPHEVDLETLATKGIERFELDENDRFSAHPKIDPITGNMVSVSYNMLKPPFCTVIELDKNGKLLKKTPVALPKGVMVHETMMTPNYVLVLDMPLALDLERAKKGLNGVAFEKGKEARIGLLKRLHDGSDIKWYPVQSGFIYHGANAWEEEGEVVFHGFRATHTDVLLDLDQAPKDGSNEAKLHTYRFNLVTGQVLEKNGDMVSADFPRINDQYIGKKNQFIYSVGFAKDTFLPKFDKIIKYDLAKNSKRTLCCDSGSFIGETVFAPRIGSKSEDDGYLVHFLHDERKNCSQCMIYDAKNLSEKPLAAIRIPVRVPYGFHAVWINS